MSGRGGHTIPLPGWWLEAISKARAATTDTRIAEAIRSETGRSYSKFQISRYFAGTTTYELTLDLWRTLGRAHAIPPPLFVASTRSEAVRLAEALGL